MKPSLYLLLVAFTFIACTSPGLTPSTSSRLFTDDFSQDLNLWETFDEPGATSQITDGQLMISLTNPSAVAFSVAAINVTDFDLTVKATLVNGGVANSYGVIFRYTDQQNFYRFDLSGDGMWGVSRRQGDRWISIVELMPSSAIHTGLSSTNAIRIIGRGQDFVFYTNDAELGRITDNNLSVGRVGLFASTFDDPDAQVSFDDINIVKP